ncbi:uncharacterized protein H6S33_004522 [Morchella sextelata]|uniref:uncharacterized protein n=1 Tax=Morchella sextelata TaxID=1174677 RepID=UPI001D04A4EE|nr:uncharacterized protein H6S33_004522 [Morchella sextelata]KAH0606065.1 hypothetical protein H6S33_004522 [Morchella sextelata]
MSTPNPPTWAPPNDVEEFKRQYEVDAAELFKNIAVLVQRIRLQRDTLSTQFAAANETIDNLEEQVIRLNLDLNVAHAASAPTVAVLVAAAPPPATAPAFRSEKFPDPEKFDGTRTKLLGFTTQLRMKLEVNHDRFRNEAAKVIYAISRLEGRALDQVVPLVNANPAAPFSSVTAFVAHLEASFGDPDSRGTARRQLVALKQGKGDFATYYSQFLRIVAYLYYNEGAKIDALTEGLSEDLKDAITYRTDRPNTIEAYATMFGAVKLNNGLFGIRWDNLPPPPLSHTHLIPPEASPQWTSPPSKPVPLNALPPNNDTPLSMDSAKPLPPKNNGEGTTISVCTAPTLAMSSPTAPLPIARTSRLLRVGFSVVPGLINGPCPRPSNVSPLSAFSISGFSVSSVEDKLDGDHFVASCKIVNNKISIQTHALIDTGCSGSTFIDETFARHNNLLFLPLQSPRTLEVIDGRPISSGQITQLCYLPLSIDSHHETIPFFVTKLGSYPLVLGIPWLQLHDVTLRFKDNSILFDSEYCKRKCNSSATPVPIRVVAPPPRFHLVSSAALCRFARRDKLQIFSTTIEEIDQTMGEAPKENWRNRVPTRYKRFHEMMDEKFANEMPPRRPYDHKIPLKEGKEPPFGPLYGMSREELVVLKQYIQDNLQKGFIQASSSPTGAPVLFVKKIDGTLRLCVDYRGLNELTVKNRYPLPLIRETLDRLSKVKWYTKLDLRQGYNQIRMAEGRLLRVLTPALLHPSYLPEYSLLAPLREGEEWKTAFLTRYGHFEYTVMPFGLTNAPATLQHFINDCVRDYLDMFCTAYLDDILIYSDTFEEHQVHVEKVLEALQRNGVLLKPEKCEFHTQSTTYLGLIIEPNGIKMDPRKVETVKNWTVPKTVKDVQAFLGFPNFYRRSIRGFSELASPLTRLTRKDIPFEWTPEAQTAFNDLKEAFPTAPILTYFDPEKKLLWKPMHLTMSLLHSRAERNYEIYDKELLAIIRSFEEWRLELEGAAHPIAIISDHKNLEYFISTKQLNRRQARWAEYLSRFNFVIKYRPGKQGGKPDTLTRRSGDLPGEGDERQLYQSQVVLKKENLDAKLSLLAGSFSNQPAEKNASLYRLFYEGYCADPFPQKILDMRNKGERQSKDISLAECTEVEGRLLYRDSIYVPDYDPLKLQILQLYHDAASAGYPGREKTFELISRDYYWPLMRNYIARYVRNCHTCQRSKPNTHGKVGVFRPLPIPEQPWREVSMDFVTGLPESEGYDAIMVVIDRLTDMRHLLPCNTTINSEDVAQVYLRNIWKLHGLPTHVTSDRSTQFTAKFWRALCKHLDIEARMSTAFHLETDGQTERLNAVMEQYLRGYVSYQQDDWVKWLPMAEFSANNQVSASTKATPFFANYDFQPRFTVTIKPLDGTPPSLNAKDFASKMKELHPHLRSNIRTAQDQQEQAINTK